MKVIYNISGMTCMHCVKAVEIELKEAGIKNFPVEIGKVEAEISDSTYEQKIIYAIKEAGYEVI